MKIRRNYVGYLAILMLAASCSSDNAELNEPEQVFDPAPEELTDINLSSAQKHAVRKTNDLTFGLFQQILSHETLEKQVCVSPLSYLNALAMAANGASDETVDNILGIFDLSGDSDEALQTLNATCKEFVYKLPSIDDKASFSMTNSLWIGDALSVNNTYVQILEKNYGGKVVTQNPSGEDGRLKVNSWVNEYTQGLIPNFLDNPLSSDVLLLNTIYFKGEWAVTFDKDKTSKEAFRNFGGTISEADFMQTELETSVADQNGLTLVSLPFGKGAYTMSFIINEQKDDFELTSTDWEALSAQAKKSAVKVVLPKFDFSYGASIKESVEYLFPGSLGNTVFSKILSNNGELIIDDILHKTKISIDEEKCEGAAATGITFVTSPDDGDGAEPPIRKIRFDHPFYFVLQEKTTGAILFLGKISGF